MLLADNRRARYMPHTYTKQSVGKLCGQFREFDDGKKGANRGRRMLLRQFC